MRRQALILLATLVAVLLLAAPGPARAAEVLQVRGPTTVEVGDRNRTLTVELACLEVEVEDAASATAWLREALPRRTRVNLRPLGERQGRLVARVQRLDHGEDAADGLIAAGLAHSLPCP